MQCSVASLLSPAHRLVHDHVHAALPLLPRVRMEKGVACKWLAVGLAEEEVRWGREYGA